MKKLFLIIVLIISTSTSYAQLFEGGLFLGGSNYIGDIGPDYYINPNFPAGGIIAKFNFTPRINFRGTLIATQINAKDIKADSDFRVGRGLSVKNNLIEASGGIEFNFFKYSMNQVGFSQTPYIIVQGTIASYAFVDPDTFESKRSFNIMPSFGLGYKTRIAENFAVSFETSVRYTLKDNIDETSVSNIGTGNINSDDWYVFTGFTITYGFGRAGCYKGFF